MFEPWLKMFDVIGGMMSSAVEAAGSLVQHTAVSAASVMEESAKGGDSVAGPWGGAVCGTMGFMLGSAMGVWTGTGILSGMVPSDAAPTAESSDEESEGEADEGGPRKAPGSRTPHRKK